MKNGKKDVIEFTFYFILDIDCLFFLKDFLPIWRATFSSFLFERLLPSSIHQIIIKEKWRERECFALFQRKWCNTHARKESNQWFSFFYLIYSSLIINQQVSQISMSIERFFVLRKKFDRLFILIVSRDWSTETWSLIIVIVMIDNHAYAC